jgi:hypothetical protein
MGSSLFFAAEMRGQKAFDADILHFAQHRLIPLVAFSPASSPALLAAAFAALLTCFSVPVGIE